MKKFLSIILACAMIMSLFCVVPASAAIAETNYILDDFESGVTTNTFTNLAPNSTEVCGGTGAAKWVASAAAGTTGTVNVPDLDLVSKSTLSAGKTVKVSFKFKLTHAMEANSRLFLIGIMSGSTTPYPESTRLTYDNTNTTTWQTFSQTLLIPADTTSVSNLYIRTIPATNNARSQFKPAAAMPATAEIGMYIDDLEVEIIGDQGEFTFDGGTNLTTYMTGSLTKVSDPVNSTNTVYKATPVSNGGAYNLAVFWAKLPSTMPIATGDVINFSARVRSVAACANNSGVGMQVIGYSALPNLGTESANTKINTSSNWVGRESDLASMSFNVTNTNWQNVSCSYTVPAGSGATFAGIRLYFNKNFGSAGGVLIDDIKLSVNPKTPSVSGLSATVSTDGTLSADYTFTKGVGDAEATDASVIKVVNANGGIVASALSGQTVTVPAAYVPDALAGNLTMAVIPRTADGYFGNEVTCAIFPEVEISLTMGAFTQTAGDGTPGDTSDDTYSITASISMLNKLASGATLNATCIVAVYNADGEMIKFAFGGGICANTRGDDTAPAMTGTTAATMNYAEYQNAAYAKAFLWDCGDSSRPSPFTTTMVELAPMVTVNK